MPWHLSSRWACFCSSPKLRVQTPWLPRLVRRKKMPRRKPKSPILLTMNAFLPAFGRAVLLVPETDEQIGAQADAFPADEHEEHVARGHEREHHEDEEVQVGEVPGEAFIVVHVAGGVDVDEKADARDDEAHDNRERIDPETDASRRIHRIRSSRRRSSRKASPHRGASGTR